MKSSMRAAVATVTLLAASPALAGADPFLGEIMLVGYTFCPRDWAEANGQLVSIAANTALFSLYGCTYGGDCRSTFALPDLRGRVAMHVNSGGNPPSPLPPNVLGEIGGSPSTTLTISQLPAHTHQLYGTASAPSQPSPGNGMLGTFPAGQNIYASGPANAAMSAAAIGSTGNNLPVSLYQPYLVLRYCVAMAGIFPSRN